MWNNRISSILCNGGTDGKLQAVATGGTAPFTYIWNTNPIQTTSVVTNLGAGTYNVVITDANGCTSACSYTLTEPAALACATTATDVACAGDADGTATVSVTGGTPTLPGAASSIYSEDFEAGDGGWVAGGSVGGQVLLWLLAQVHYSGQGNATTVWSNYHLMIMVVLMVHM